MNEKESKEKAGMPEPVPYIVYEGDMVRMERVISRLWIALIVSLALMFLSNVGWLVQTAINRTINFQQTVDGMNSINTGTQGGLMNGAEETETETWGGTP